MRGKGGPMAEKKRLAKAKSLQKTTARHRSGSAKKPGNAPRPVAQQNPLRKNDNKSFTIVGIGASAGGLEAFEQFFRHMPADSGMAFILVSHLDPTHKSILGDLLKRYTNMEIFQAEDGMVVEPNCVYLIPPNKDMSILHGSLQLFEPVKSLGIRHPIDFFFRSLAEDRGEKAIGIVLSGTGTEGALGLKAIKGEGGLVLAQEVKTAKYDGMPASAIATGIVDYVLSPDKMPEQLLNYIRRPYSRPLLTVETPSGKSQELLQKIYVLIRAQTGHDFSLYKQNTILRRVEKRMAIHQIERLTDYVTYLRDNPAEVDALFRELLIRVTSFFRDPEAFEVIEEKVLPHLLKNRTYDDPIRVWVPGCSTGEEAYSLAILFHQYLQKTKKNIRVQIFATDIDSVAIDSARAGIYEEGVAADLSDEQRERYFVKKGATYRVREEIRAMVVFAVQNVVKDPPFSRIDMISCRNLLIYLSGALQKKVLPLFNYSLRPDGVLFLGSSETIGDHADLFSVLDKKWKVFKAKRGPGVQVLDGRRPAAERDRDERTVKGPGSAKPGEPDIGVLTEQLLLDSFTPPCVIVNAQGNILYVHGRTGAYLEPASGKARFNVLDMAREGIRLELRMGLRKIMSQKKRLLFSGLHVKTNGNVRTADLELKYISKPEHLRGLVMIVFHEMQQAKVPKTTKGRAQPPKKALRHIAELELELKSTKEHLHSTVEELETSNEELKSTNEELQSSNEELQSTNEEIETSKEELQSVNEELMMVNAELQTKIDDLSQANSDMINLLAGTQIATVFLGSDLRIKRFTPTAIDLINLIQTDVGRPISDIASKLEYQELAQDAQDVLRTLVSKEKEVRGTNGRWYLMRIMPYRTLANVIDGVVITFIDITEQKKTQETLRDALEFSEGIVETVREPLMVLDADLRVLRTNGAFYTTFKVAPADTEKKLIYELGSRQWDIPALRELLEKVLPENTQVRDFVVDHEFPGIGRKKMLLNARRVLRRDSQTRTILLAIEDISDKR